MSGPQAIEAPGGRPIKAWTEGVPVGEAAIEQLRAVARLPFVYPHVAAMPDVHVGKGATIGSVIPCRGAIVPAAVGVDIGCGMMAVETSLTSHQLPDTLEPLRAAIEKAVPHGRGAWKDVPEAVAGIWHAGRREGASLADGLAAIVERHPGLAKANSAPHLGTLGTGNHFIEVCLDERDRVWVMLHSGSRGIGNAIGRHFIELAREEMARADVHLPDRDLAYLTEGSQHFDDYVQAVGWAQAFALANREVMMTRVLDVMARHFRDFAVGETAVNCHHNYVAEETHYGERVWLTRKGAVRARRGELGIIPGSMGAKSYMVRGLGNPASFSSCAHGAGRAMSRTEAKRRLSLEDHARDTEGVACRKDKGVLDESPKAYKDIDAVMAAQADLVDIVHTLKQVVCVKG